MANSMTWFKFAPLSWLGDPAVRACSHAARGLWIDMLCIMHAAEPYGHLLVAGKPPTPKMLAGICGGSIEEVTAELAELAEGGVFTKTDAGVIYSRRMVRDRETYDDMAKRGSVGGKNSQKQKGRSAKAHAQAPAQAQTADAAQAPAQARVRERLREEKDSEKKESSSSATPLMVAGWDFDQFWDTYPLKVGMKTAKKSFEKVEASERLTFAELLAHLRRYKLNKPPDRDWCHATTWLNGARWEDRYPHERVPAPARIDLSVPAVSLADWDRYVAEFRRIRRWDNNLGPAPDDPYCRAPLTVRVRYEFAHPPEAAAKAPAEPAGAPIVVGGSPSKAPLEITHQRPPKEEAEKMRL